VLIISLEKDFDKKEISSEAVLPYRISKRQNSAMGLKAIILLLSFVLFADAEWVYCETLAYQSADVTVFYEKDLTNMAREISTLYAPLKDELSRTLKQNIDFRPEVVLIGERDRFVKMSGSGMISAFALPGRNLIVLDASRAFEKPFTLETTLKHELCHLVLHHRVGGKDIPRWFDEGVCQWASGGIAELMTEETDKALVKAVMFERLIGLNDLERFPPDGKSLILAYEESKSVIEYIASEYGKDAVLRMVESMREGDSVNEAVREALSVSHSELERNWHMHLNRKYTWFFYLSNNLYAIIFFLAAVITLYGFVRLLRKKRAYADAEEEENDKNREA
jgi:hypothetical protein